MSRVIKYRGKNTKTNEWVYGGYYKHLKRTPSPIGDRIKEDDWKSLIINSGFSDWNMPKPLNCFEVNQETVGLFTGLKDRNGKEIYEGDLFYYRECLRQVVYREDNLSFMAVVPLKKDRINGKCSFYLKDINTEYHLNKIEVVGNIYDNLELI